jgi:hypothetical protein
MTEEARLKKIEERLDNQDEINKEMRNLFKIIGRQLDLE